MVVISAPANPARCPPGALRARQPDRALSQDQKAALEGDRARRQGQLHHAAAVPDRLEGALSRPDRMGFAVERRHGDLGRCRDARRSSPTSTSTRPRSPTSSRRRRPAASPRLAGVADRTGWCPIDPVTFESKLQPNIHVIGDAAIAGAMPKSASAANSQGEDLRRARSPSCWPARRPTTPTLTSTCYSLIAPDYAHFAARQSIGRSTASTPRSRAARSSARSTRRATARKAEAELRRRLVPHHHRRGVRMKRRSRLPLAAARSSLRAGIAPERAAPLHGRRRRHSGLADRDAGRSGARPRDRGQPRRVDCACSAIPDRSRRSGSRAICRRT